MAEFKEGGELPNTPEKALKQLQSFFFALPVFTRLERTEGETIFDEGKKFTKMAFNRINSEYRKTFEAKLDSFLNGVKSNPNLGHPTNSFIEEIKFMFDSLYGLGRGKDNPRTESEGALTEAIGITGDRPVNFFNPSETKLAEDALYNYYQKHLLDVVKSNLEDGLDMDYGTIPQDDPTTLKQKLEKWEGEYFELYGVNPPSPDGAIE